MVYLNEQNWILLALVLKKGKNIKISKMDTTTNTTTDTTPGTIQLDVFK